MMFGNRFTPLCVIMLGALIQWTSAADPVPIYGEDSNPVGLTIESQKIIVAILTIMIFVLMAFEVTTPEVVLFSSLVICLLLQILTLPETLSGTNMESN